MARPRIHKETVSTKLYDYLNNPPAGWADYVVSNKRRAQDVMYKGTDISARVSAAGTRKLNKDGDVDGGRGFSNEVSRGKRPVHKAGTRNYKRV
jgi:hypothetical protein